MTIQIGSEFISCELTEEEEELINELLAMNPNLMDSFEENGK